MKKNRTCIIAPTAVMVIMMSVFYYYRMFPFGDKTLSWCDMNQQVIPFLMDFKDILSGKANMFLNMQNAGGMSFWGVFLFFISSPFTFLVTLVNKGDMYHFVNILVMVKMMVCAITASLFFNRQFKALNAAQNVALSVMYAFCGYTMFYYQNQVWLDVMYLFPILLLGLIKLVEEDRVWLFVLAFSAILTVNFYLSYMVCIFLVLSFGIYLIMCVPVQRRRKNILLLGISTLIVAFITAVVWLPSLMQYVNSARTGNLISSLKVGRLFTRFDTTLTVLLCTGALFAAVILYAFNISKYTKKTASSFFIFILTLIPVFIEPINKMWQTGNYQAFPVRYGYITIFFGLILLASIISTMNDKPALKQSNSFSLFGAMLAVAALFVAACLLITKDYDTISVYTKTLWGNQDSFTLLLAFSFTAGLAYLVFLLLYQFKLLGKTAFSAFLCAVVLIECIFNSSVYIASAANSTSNYTPVIDLSDKIHDAELYRVKMDQKYFDVNLAGSMGYNTLSHYTSLTNESFMYTMKKLGYSSYWMEVNSNGGTELTDAVLGNRYSIIKTEDIKSNDLVIYKNSQYALKQNSASLPVGFVINADDIQTLKMLPDTTRLNIQQALFQSVFHTDQNVVTQYEPTRMNNVSISKDGEYRITFPDNARNGILNYAIPVKGTQTLYFDCFDRLSNSLIEHINSSFNIYVNGAVVQSDYPNQSNNGLVKLGTFTDQTVQIQIEVLKEVSAKSFGLAGLDLNALNTAINNAVPAKLEQVNNKIIGTASAQSSDAYLFLPLTYGNGYTAYVNDKKAEVSRVFDSMIAIKLEKGENTISVSYLPPGFTVGTCLSAAGLFMLLGVLLFLRKGLYRKIEFLEIPAVIIFWLICIGVFATIYLFPLIVYFKK